MNFVRLVLPVAAVWGASSCAQSAPKVVQVPHNASAPASAKATPAKVKLFDAHEHQWQGTGTKRTRPRFGVKGKNGFFFTSGMTIDADGSPRAFNRVSSKGLDDLQNAGHPGNWWGIMTNNGETSGRPIMQRKGDPAPGFYISQTGLEDTSKRETDPNRYVDAERVPYIVLSGTKKQNMDAQFGDYAVVLNKANGKYAFALCGDEWPEVKIGEGSIALAKAIGVPADPRDGGVDDGIVYLIFPHSRRTPWHAGETLKQTDAAAQKVLDAWGGIEQLRALAK